MSLNHTTSNADSSSSSLSSFFSKNETLIKYTLVPSIPLSIIAILSADPTTWVTSEIHHFYIELFAVILAAVLAFYYISRAHTLDDKFSLFVGVGFLTSALIDLLHVMVSYFAMSDPIFLKYFIPQTWFAGRIFLSSMLVVAIAKYSTLSKEEEVDRQVETTEEGGQPHQGAQPQKVENESDEGQQQYQEQQPTRLHKTVKLYLIILIVMAGSIAVSSLYLVFPAIVIDNYPIHRPYEIPSLVLFITALLFFYKRQLYKKKDAFYKGILGYLTVDIFSQIIMCYSATSFDTAHNVAHVLKDAGYFVNIIALALSSIQYNVVLKERNAIIRMQYEKLKESEKMKDEFINIAAHELRTPIQPILGLSNIVQSKITDTKQLELLDVIIRNAKRLAQLSSNVLDATKIESKSLKLNKQQLNLNIVIGEILKEYAGKIEEENKRHGVNIIYDLKQKDDDIIVEADKDRLAQVISNLLSNALKFTKQGGGAISINVERKEEGQVIVSVKDTGEGIDPRIFPNIFSKFVSTSHSGTGLGLFICKSIIEAHGGKIWAENYTNGEKGATFSFTLRIVKIEQQEKQH